MPPTNKQRNAIPVTESEKERFKKLVKRDKRAALIELKSGEQRWVRLEAPAKKEK